jgi:hypothetical protein
MYLAYLKHKGFLRLSHFPQIGIRGEFNLHNRGLKRYYTSVLMDICATLSDFMANSEVFYRL